jgi:molybdopterin-guanine dinucleotide biosynthesis protein A
MGTDKALAEIGDRPMALRVADALAAVCDSVSLVGDPARYGHLGLPVVPDRFPGWGPLAGIEAALAATDCDWNLIVACDMPSLAPVFLESLFPHPDADSDADCLLPRHADGNVEPLCAAYHRRVQAAILAALESGVRKVTDALRPLAVNYVPAGALGTFANLNTPDELRKYLHG